MISINPSRCLLLIVLATFGGLSLPGCAGNSDGFERFPVEGLVTLDGQPLKSGKILFNAQQQGASSFGEITEGKYNLKGSDSLSPGPYRVEIYGLQSTGRQTPSADDPKVLVDETIDVVPRRYNVQSTLSANLPAGGPKEPLKFALTSEESKSKNPGSSKPRRR